MIADEPGAASAPAGPRTAAIDCDVLVIGSGAGGLSAAVTAAFHGLKVIVVEKEEKCGGATAFSGGWMWAPRNPLAVADGVKEDIELPREYLRQRLGENFDAARVDALLEAVPHMVGFFHTKTKLQFVPGSSISDIYGKTPGAGTGHRSVAPKPINARRLSKTVRATMRRQLYETSFLGMGIMAGPDLRAFLFAMRGDAKALWHATWRVGLHLWDLLTHHYGLQLVNGTALIGRLMQSAENLGVDIRVSSPALRLTTDAGRVTGAVVASPRGGPGDEQGGELSIHARLGVVLATGGFPNDVARRKQYFPRVPTGEEHWTLAPAGTSGDGITLGESVGGHLNHNVAAPAAYCPVSLVHYRNGRVGVFPHIMDRGKPGAIGVLKNGRRFVNEANGYHDYVLGMLAAVPEGEPVESWLVADHTFQRRYPLGMSKQRPVPTFPYLRNGYLTKGRTIEELARNCGIDPAGLAATVVEFNANARRGADPLFERGETPFNRYAGDPTVKPNPSLAPIKTGPFYAVKVLPGSFGTFMGLETDARARVLGDGGKPIAGLYAVGTDQANVMGGHYPAGGINIGPAMTFGYVAGRDLAGATAYEDGRDAAVENGSHGSSAQR
ncbi:FAD-dependent oxidoreductase [Leifsonia sp. Root112D2]|uniref:FAD-dependent oxidoreductase n=1 Tax=Leifsonia sp. Root112D2 TaxID=1736426 RepID=UPI0006FEF6A0|nr:FAD-dependent oxidoreductase [Leifsonia sp. Root112D2]KQV06788.1 FAD-binding dehydrogenase [Leifsonia sp. Root112D2]